MITNSRRNENSDFEILFSIAVVLLFFSSGSFGLLNIVGIRREAQYFLLLLIFTTFLGLHLAKVRPWREPVLGLAIVISIFSYLNTGDNLLTFNFLTAVIGLYGLSALHPKTVKTLSRILLSFCSLFAFMGLIQLILFWKFPGKYQLLQAPYSSETGADVVNVYHPIQYLGFFDSINNTKIFGIPIPRFSSFAAEPSVMAYSFLVPGLLGLGDNGIFNRMGIFVTLYCLFMVQSGTIWLCLLSGIFVYISVVLNLRTMKFSVKWLSIIMVMLVYILLRLISQYNPGDIGHMIKEGTSGLSEVSNVVASKQLSAEVRLRSTAEGLSLVTGNPMGYRGIYVSAGRALVVDIGLVSGWIGLIVLTIGYYILIKTQLKWVVINSNPAKSLAAASLIGTQIVMLFFSSYGWMTFSGFLALGLIAKTAEFGSVRKQAPHNEHMVMLNSSTNQF